MCVRACSVVFVFCFSATTALKGHETRREAVYLGLVLPALAYGSGEEYPSRGRGGGCRRPFYGSFFFVFMNIE